MPPAQAALCVKRLRPPPIISGGLAFVALALEQGEYLPREFKETLRRSVDTSGSPTSHDLDRT
jgi:hypothetical protein